MNLSLNADHDLHLTASQLVLLSDADALAQRIKTNLATYRGEFWLNREIGVPYFQSVLGKSPDLELIRTIFRAQILQVSGVVSLDALDLSLDNTTRVLSVTFKATGSLGEVAQGEFSI